MQDEELASALRLAEARELSPRRVRRLYEAFGSFQGALSASATGWAEALGCPVGTAGHVLRLARRVRPDRLLRSARRIDAWPLAFGHPDYPELLAGIPDPPVVLWGRGRVELLVHPLLAVVGARRCSVAGVDQATRFVADCTRAGWNIVSGGARGIDSAAHREAMRCESPTVVVLGSGLDRPYPPEHADLFDHVVEQGGLVISEYPGGREPRPGQFPARNRVVAGLAAGVVMIEAGRRSGALITGRLAGEDYGREVMAVPGELPSGRSAGCHQAIREGWAALVDEPEHVLEQLRDSEGLLRTMVDALKNRLKVKEIGALADEEKVAERLARVVRGAVSPSTEEHAGA